MKHLFLAILVNLTAVSVITAVGCYSHNPIPTNTAMISLFAWFNLKMVQCY